MTLKTSIKVPLTVAVAVKAEDGKDANRNEITLRRPKLRHAKALAGLIGPTFVAALMDGDETEIEKIDKAALVKEIANSAMKPETLDQLTQIIADICGEDKAFIDDIDLVDLSAVGMAFLDFFPALQSLVPTK